MPETNPEGERGHHEEGLSHQMKFQPHVDDFVDEINEYDSPFDEKCQELLVLNTKEGADVAIVTTVCTIEDLGKRQGGKYCKKGRDLISEII